MQSNTLEITVFFLIVYKALLRHTHFYSSQFGEYLMWLVWFLCKQSGMMVSQWGDHHANSSANPGYHCLRIHEVHIPDPQPSSSAQQHHAGHTSTIKRPGNHPTLESNLKERVLNDQASLLKPVSAQYIKSYRSQPPKVVQISFLKGRTGLKWKCFKRSLNKRLFIP